MFRKSVITAVLPVFFVGAMPAEGSDWMFRQSWFSDGATMVQLDGNGVPPGVTCLAPQGMPNPRSAYRPAIPQRGPGFSIRSKYRFNYYRLNSGQSFDTTIYREFSFEASP